MIKVRELACSSGVADHVAVGERIVTEGSFLLRAEYLKSASANHSH